MGVKYLWRVLRRIASKKKLRDLANKRLAVDLSGWVVALSQEGGYKRSLRNVFFRAKRLLLLGIHPVFVLQGKAPYFKASTIMARRKIAQRVSKKKGKISLAGGGPSLGEIERKCQQIFEALGLSSVQSPGEAEKCCALLEKNKFVDGCITQDSDIFLYGGETVYRDFSLQTSIVEEYNMSAIQKTLCLSRRDMIAVSLLCGCDYYKGVTGVGIKSAMEFLNSIEDEDGLTRLIRWQNDTHFKDLENERSLIQKRLVCDVCGHDGRRVVHIRLGCKICGCEEGCVEKLPQQSSSNLNTELDMRRRALSDPVFPPKDIIDEFCDDFLPVSCDTTWKKPDIDSFKRISAEYFGWSETYAIRSFLPIVTRWQINELQRVEDIDCQEKFSFFPTHIIKKRTLKGVLCFEIQWRGPTNILQNPCDNEKALVTVEPQNLVLQAYPNLVKDFVSSKHHQKSGYKASRKQTLSTRGRAGIRKQPSANSSLHMRKKLPWSLRSQNTTDNIRTSPRGVSEVAVMSISS